MKKAYDNVSLTKLDDIMHELIHESDVLEEWNNEYQDLLQLNIALDEDHVIKRTDGLP
jgi:hypothetical protein